MYHCNTFVSHFFLKLNILIFSINNFFFFCTLIWLRCNSLLLLFLKVGGVSVMDTEQEIKNAHSLLKAIRNWNNLE